MGDSDIIFNQNCKITLYSESSSWEDSEYNILFFQGNEPF